MSKTSCDLISKVLNSFALILMNELLTFDYGDRHCGADWPTCAWVSINGFPTYLEPSMPSKHLHMAHAFFTKCLSKKCPGSLLQFFWDLHKVWWTFTVLLSYPSQNCIRPDTWLKKKRHENQHISVAANNFLHWLSKCASTIICCCIAQLQLLYICHHQSWILCTPLYWFVGECVFLNDLLNLNNISGLLVWQTFCEHCL
jgi:hypothetical protein